MLLSNCVYEAEAYHGMFKDGGWGHFFLRGGRGPKDKVTENMHFYF